MPILVEEVDQYVDDCKTIKTSALLDSGASTTFISERVVKHMGLKTHKFKRPIPLLNIDGTTNMAGRISHYAYLNMMIPHAGGHQSKTIFAITDIDDQDVILGIDWLQKHNPHINWKEGTISLQCCSFQRNPLVIKRTRPPGEIRKYSFYEELKKMYERKDPAYTILASFSKSQELAIKAMDGKERTFSEMVLKAYHDYTDVFSKDKSNRMPEHKPWDLEIIIKEGQELPKPRKAFPMSPKELQTLKDFIKQELDLGRIRPSKSETSAPVFFIKKKDGGLRFVQDYRALNAVTVKNRYPIPLSSDLVDQLREAKYFTHLDLRNGYNNI